MYEARKANDVECVKSAQVALPGLREAADLILPGTPVTFQRFTRRAWVGACPKLAAACCKHWEMPVEAQRTSGRVIGQDYPAPIVNHGEARERVLAAYRDAKM